MLNCAICDNNKYMVTLTKEMIINALRDNECVGNIEVYTDSRLFISDVLEYKPLDIVVMDVEMPYYNGLQIAEEIKKRFPECRIIFLTSHIEYAVESYELEIFRFALKSKAQIKLPQYLKEAIKAIYSKKESTYIILKNEILERLPYRQMLYVRKEGKYSIITCVDKREIRVRKPLREVRDELGDKEFLAIDRGCIVNIALIYGVIDNEVICKNGEHLPISRSKLKETKTRIAQYWRGGL